MSAQERKSGCFSVLVKGIGAFLLLSVVMAVGGRFVVNTADTDGKRTSSSEQNVAEERKVDATPEKTESVFNLSSVSVSELPKEVALKVSKEFKVAAGSVTAPRGSVVKLISLSGNLLTVEFSDARESVPVKETDLQERIVSARRLAREKEEARIKAEKEAAERAKEEEARLKAVQEENYKKLISEIGKEPKPIGDKPPGLVRLALKSQVKDPDSLQYIKAFKPVVTYYQGRKCWGLKFQFRAKNSFGGYVVGTGFAYIYQGEVLDLKIEESF